MGQEEARKDRREEEEEEERRAGSRRREGGRKQVPRLRCSPPPRIFSWLSPALESAEGS